MSKIMCTSMAGSYSIPALSVRMMEDERFATTVTTASPCCKGQVMGLAILAIVDGELDIYRTDVPARLEAAKTNGAYYFVGAGDEHDPGAGFFNPICVTREDDTPFGVAGSVWAEYGAKACKTLTNCTDAQAENVARIVDKALIKRVDAVAHEDQMCKWNEAMSNEAFMSECWAAYDELSRNIIFWTGHLC